MGVQAGKGPQSTAPATKSALQGPHKVLHLPPFLKTNHMSKSHDSLHLSRHQSTSKISTMSKVHAPATKSTSKQNRSDPLRACHEKSRLWPPKRGFPCACHASDHRAQKCARRHNESAVATSTRRDHPDFASLRSRHALRGF